MKECYVQASNLTDGYHKSLLYLNEEGALIECPDWDTTQKEVSMTIHIDYPLQEPMISKLCICSPEALEQYRQEMLYGILDFKIDSGWDYTYHDRMVNFPTTDGSNATYNQIQFIIDELKRNPQSRRAVIDIRNNTEDMYSNDPACLQHIQYFIRDNCLDCCVLFRSNDACKATFMNMFALIKLQELIANQLGVEVGTYTHRANSFHCYERDFNDLNNYCDHIKKDPIEKLTFTYVDGWDKKMEKSKANIKSKIVNLQEEK